jgi:hypothetical protein
MILASANQSVAALQQRTQSVPIVLANVIDPSTTLHFAPNSL